MPTRWTFQRVSLFALTCKRLIESYLGERPLRRNVAAARWWRRWGETVVAASATG
jgi:hypothetical protein